jgi:hypothetical protein
VVTVALSKTKTPGGKMLDKAAVSQQVLKIPRKDLPRQIQACMKEEIRPWRSMREETKKEAPNKSGVVHAGQSA